MSATCPKCNGVMRSKGIKKRASGNYRKMICLSCGYFEKHQVDGKGKLPPSNRRYNAEQIHAMVTSTKSSRELARLYGCSPQMVRQVWAGKIYRDLLPPDYVPRDPSGPSCLRCASYRPEWSPPCWWRFPDLLEEGPQIARDCQMFQEVA